MPNLSYLLYIYEADAIEVFWKEEIPVGWGVFPERVFTAYCSYNADFQTNKSL
jgi:hypothetical protein